MSGIKSGWQRSILASGEVWDEHKKVIEASCSIKHESEGTRAEGASKLKGQMN